MEQHRGPNQSTAAVGGGRCSVPGPLDQEFARWLRMRKSDFLAPGAIIMQTGAAYLAGRFPVGPLIGGSTSFTEPMTEPVIETFVVGPDGRCEGTGGDPRLIEAWLPLATDMVKRVLDAMHEHAVAMEFPAYLTVSLTPPDQVTQSAHIDDDQYLADDGVGVVAIAASHDGPLIANEAVAHRPVGPMLPLEFEDGVSDRFSAGELARQHADPDRIVVFPQFGQLHSGPPVDAGSPDRVRRLLVFRAGTRPAVVAR